MSDPAELQIPEGLPFDLSASFRAVGYQRWILDFIRPWLGKRILEFGARCGAMSRHFTDAERLILIEPDPALLKLLDVGRKRWFPRPEDVSLHALFLPGDSLKPFCGDRIDTILSFNVLEHIEDDLSTLKALADLLRNSQPDEPRPRRLISFVPAHPFAYGSLDKADGHYRRYSRAAFKKLAKAAAPEATYRAFSFNSFGLWGWFLNGRILKKPAVDHSTIDTFESLLPWLKPFDTVLMRYLHFPFGQSLVTILEWPAGEA